MGYDEEYEELLANAKASPESVDFEELRLAYAKSSHYFPYAVPSGDLYASVDVSSGTDGEAALSAVRQRLESNYVDIQAHLLAASVYGRIGEIERAKYHYVFGERLVRSILESGDGRTRQTAFTVISVAEEYAVLGFLGLEPGDQAFWKDKEHDFDEMQVLHPPTGMASTWYFNIDVPQRWYRRRMDEDPEALLAAFNAAIGQAGDKVSKPNKRWQFGR